MYLSKLTLNLRSPQARLDVADAYEMHRTLTRAFAADVISAPSRFLWRLDFGRDSRASPTVLIQSLVAGRWSVLDQLPNYLHSIVQSKQLTLDTLIRSERRYRFRLRANPTVTKGGKRYGLVKEPEQLAWLSRQGERHGFLVEASIITDQDVFTSRRKSATLLCVQRTCYEGVLQIQRSEAVRQALVGGIGPAKAFGCGLLSLAPI